MSRLAVTTSGHHSPSLSEGERQQDSPYQAASTGSWESHGLSPKSSDKSSPRFAPRSPKGKIGRPLKHDKDINNPALTEDERRKIRRRTANRMSARRVRDRRAHTATELEATIGRAAAENQVLLNKISNAESECLAASQQLSSFHEKLVGLNSSNMRLHCRQALLQNSINQAQEQQAMMEGPQGTFCKQVELPPLMSNTPITASMARPQMTLSMPSKNAFSASLHMSEAPAVAQPDPDQTTSMHHFGRTSWVQQDMSEGVPQAAASAAYTSSASDHTLFPGQYSQFWEQPDYMDKLASFNLDDDLTAALDSQYKEDFQGV